MDLFHCVSTGVEERGTRAKSADRSPSPLARQSNTPARRPSLPAPPPRLTSRTLSPAPSTLTRKYSRTGTCGGGTARLPRHPELPPLSSSQQPAPSLADYLEKPRLVNTGASRKNSQVGDPVVDSLAKELSRLSSYYNQTFLNGCDTCDSMNHKNPVSVLNPNTNRGM